MKEFVIQDYVLTNRLNFKKSLFLRTIDVILLLLIFFYVLTKSCPHLQDNYEYINCLPSTVMLSSTVFLNPNHFTITVNESFKYKGKNITNCKTIYDNNFNIPLYSEYMDIEVYSSVYCDDGISFNLKVIKKSNITENIFNITYNYINQNKNKYNTENLNNNYLQIYGKYNDEKYMIRYVKNGTLNLLENKEEQKKLEDFYYKFYDEYFNIIENQTIYISYNCNSCYNNWSDFNWNSVYLMLVGCSSLFSVYVSIKALIIKYFFIPKNNDENIPEKYNLKNDYEEK